MNSLKIKSILYDKIEKLSRNKDNYCNNPEKDFSRKRKLGFTDTIRMIVTMEGGTLNSELLKYFDYNSDTASASAFVQQRSKIKEELFVDLFNEFNSSFPYKNRLKGYQLIACDGTDLIIYNNPEDYSTFYQTKPDRHGYNMLHMDACFDLYNRRYTDIIISPGMHFSETGAMAKMLDRYEGTRRTIFIADRGFESYNVMAHAIENNLKFLIRIKDKGSNGILKGLSADLPPSEKFDIDIRKTFTTSCDRRHKEHPNIYKRVAKKCIDYIDAEHDYYMKFRILRFPIGDGKYESIVTNLPRSTFNLHTIKSIYQMRWGIETSFRELKYAIGLTAFHSKKVELIRQEIYARIIMYNFCELITTHITITKRARKYVYHINYTMAITLCRKYLRQCNDSPPIDIEKLLRRYIQPYRPGRKDSRKEIKNQPAVSFIYRIAA